MIVEIMKKGRPDIVNDGEQSLWPVNYAEYPVYKAWEIIRIQTKHPPSPERLVMQLIVLQQGEEGIFEEPQYYFVYPSKENPGKAVWERVTSRYFYCELDDRKRAIRPNPVVYWQREDSIYYYRINQVVGEKSPECDEKCDFHDLCFPDGLMENDKCIVLNNDGKHKEECKKGYKLNKLTLGFVI